MEQQSTPAGPVRAAQVAGNVVRWAWPGVVLVVLGAVAFGGLYDAVREQDDLWLVDDPILEWMVAHRSAGLTTFLTVVTTIFGPFVLPVLVAVGALVWARVAGTWWEPGLLVGAMALSTVLSVSIKALVARPRPPDDSMVVPGIEHTFSFPSGHTIGAATLVLVGGYLLWHRHHSGRLLVVWAVVSLAVTVVVAGSRLYLGYHFLTDVLAGVALAVVVLGVVVLVVRWREAQSSSPRARRASPSASA
ncbi:phosphatase PAP2 family protein [Oerskovia flava]|uniref:phosphatase PAP2 family protein n=1 Tax=Oerskovia flava TaxID=2986422 RepID=UPI00223EE64C|nr:phosphatase PAP2 family protein [Oerskovia sp. JB1-3-2]